MNLQTVASWIFFINISDDKAYSYTYQAAKVKIMLLWLKHKVIKVAVLFTAF